MIPRISLFGTGSFGSGRLKLLCIGVGTAGERVSIRAALVSASNN
jgi:hypothetical protein